MRWEFLLISFIRIYVELDRHLRLVQRLRISVRIGRISHVRIMRVTRYVSDEVLVFLEIVFWCSKKTRVLGRHKLQKRSSEKQCNEARKAGTSSTPCSFSDANTTHCRDTRSNDCTEELDFWRVDHRQCLTEVERYNISRLACSTADRMRSLWREIDGGRILRTNTYR